MTIISAEFTLRTDWRLLDISPPNNGNTYMPLLPDYSCMMLEDDVNVSKQNAGCLKGLSAMRNVLILFGGVLLLLGCVSTKNADTLTADTFTKAGLLSGSTMTQDTCSETDTSLWITVSGKEECIRYFHSGLQTQNDIVHVWLHGDRIRRNRGVNFPSGYSNESAKKQKARANRTFQRTAIPYVRLSRPGTYGSSGFHAERRRPRNVNIVIEAISALKKKFKIRRFAISGQSGGGHLVGALLANRNDILCAVSTSGVLGVRERNRIRGWSTDITGYWDFYDPIDHVDEIPNNSDRRIFIVSDPRDTNVPFRSQEKYFDAVKERGHEVFLVKAAGRGRQFHGLAHVGFDIVKWCVNGLSSTKIVERAQSRYGL